MADAAWKRAERDMARDVGTERIPVTGERQGADWRKGLFAYQLKKQKIVSRRWVEWLRGIRRKAREQDQVGVLVLMRPGVPRRDALVVVSWQDWVDLHGEPQGMTE